MKKSVIIVAGGTGKRMNYPVPKQFLHINSKPIIVHTIDNFIKYDAQLEIIVVVNSDYFDHWNEIKQKYYTANNIISVHGGETRFHSVQNGLNAITYTDVLAIHDAVRPIITYELLKRLFDKAIKKGSAIPVVSIKDSIRYITEKETKPINRNHLYYVQTPQIFNFEWIKDAYSTSYNDSFTDDASVLEHKGYPLFFVEGSPINIKITTQEDLILTEKFLNLISK